MFRDLVPRLLSARLWLLLQFVALPLLLLVAIGWSRLGEKHLWEVALSLLLPLVIIVAALALKAGTLRSLLAPLAEKHASFLMAALMLLAWAVLTLFVWHLLDLFDNQIWSWASLLNSKVPAGLRAKTLSFGHLQIWLSRIEWLLRWVAGPAILVPFALSSAERGWRIDWRAALRVVFNWRWLPAVFLLALLGVALPGKFFTYTPHGTLGTQIWSVSAKIAGAYLLAIISWFLLLGWGAVLLRRKAAQGTSAAGETSA